MQKTIVILFAAIMSISLAFPDDQDGRYRVEGTIDKPESRKAILTKQNMYGETIGSDTSFIRDGRFYFEGEEYLDGFAAIVVEDEFGRKIEKYPCSIILESGTISASYLEGKTYRSGTSLNDLYMGYCDSLSCLGSKVHFPPGWIGQGSIYIGIGTETEQALYEEGEYHIRFMKENFDNPVGKALFMSPVLYYRNSIMLSEGTYLARNARNGKSFDEIFSFVDNDTRSDPKVKAYMDYQRECYTMPSYFFQKMDDFTLSTPEGSKVQLSDYIGNKDFTFVEFWASWCGPCIASIPDMKDIYSKYPDKLEIVSISLDTDHKSWKNAIEIQNMPWAQLGDMKGFDSEIAKTFEIKGIPFGLLVDRDGVVIDMPNAHSLKFFMEHQ